MAPCEIVPALADEGIYIASESTFYRVLREEKMLNHRGRSEAPIANLLNNAVSLQMKLENWYWRPGIKLIMPGKL
mgnify:CR=1 FL=1